MLRCEAGVVTISRPECYAPCDRPKHQRHTHYNCPVCDGESSSSSMSMVSNNQRQRGDINLGNRFIYVRLCVGFSPSVPKEK